MRTYLYSALGIISQRATISNTLIITLLMINIEYGQPVAICKDITVSADDSCIAKISADEIDDGSYDKNGGSISLTIEPQNIFPLGINDAKLIVENKQGEKDECKASITVRDEMAPILTTPCPDDIRLCGPQNVYWKPPVAMDNCCIPVMKSSGSSGDFCAIGSTLVMYSFEDDSGNKTTCDFTIIIDDPSDCDDSTTKQLVQQNSINEVIEMSVFPNPASDYINLKLVSQKEATFEILIYDLLGKTLIEEKVELSKGHQIINFDVNKLNEGMHIVKLVNGSEKYVIPFTKLNSF